MYETQEHDIAKQNDSEAHTHSEGRGGVGEWAVSSDTQQCVFSLCMFACSLCMYVCMHVVYVCIMYVCMHVTLYVLYVWRDDVGRVPVVQTFVFVRTHVRI